MTRPADLTTGQPDIRGKDLPTSLRNLYACYHVDRMPSILGRRFRSWTIPIKDSARCGGLMMFCLAQASLLRT